MGTVRSGVSRVGRRSVGGVVIGGVGIMARAIDVPITISSEVGEGVGAGGVVVAVSVVVAWM